MHLWQVEWRTVGKAALREFRNDDVAGLASEIAFSCLFALFPFALFLSAAMGLVGRLVGARELFATSMATMYRALPPASARALEDPLREVLAARPGTALSAGAGALLALAFASNGVATIMKALNRAYGVEETRSFLRARLVALALTLVLGLLLVGGFVLLLFGDWVRGALADRLEPGAAVGPAWLAARLVLVPAAISLGLALLYWLGPNVEQQFKWITPGSVLAALAWVAMTAGFGLYVRVLGASSYSRYYGTLVGLILFLFYLYLTGLIILLGAELNAETTKRYDPETIRDKITDPRKQLPGKQPVPATAAAAEAGVSPAQVAASVAASRRRGASGVGRRRR